MSETPFLNPDHDHGHCLDQAISRARSVCEEHGIKFTALREKVFRAIASSHTAVGAYDIIEMLAGNGKRIAPISMYRILDALSEVGLIHRLESRNSYFACHLHHHDDDKRDKRLIFMSCNTCNTVVEIENSEIGNAIQEVSKAAGFHMSEALLEIAGNCEHCLEQQAANLGKNKKLNEKST